MPTILISTNDPRELFNAAVDAARRASATITELLRTPYAPGETREDRALTVAAHARTLVEAFSIIDGIASSVEAAELFAEVACDCSTCAPWASTKPVVDNPNAN